MAKITYTDKVDNRTIDVPDINKVTASDMNEIKASVNAAYDLIATINSRTYVSITSADFSGSTYDNSELVGLTAMEDFNVFSNDGSGVLLKSSDGYTFDDSLGRLTMEPGNYVIEIYKPVEE